MIFGITFYVALAIFLMICVIALIAMVGWISEGAKLDAAREEIKRLEYEKNCLHSIIKRQNRRSNIDVANDYYKELNKDEGNS